MIREINVSPWIHITTTEKYDHHSLNQILTILIEKDGQYFFLVDDVEKIFDVSQMPNYIKEDWINYNKKPLSLKIINEQIKKLTNDFELFEEELSLLKSLRREMIIKGII